MPRNANQSKSSNYSLDFIPTDIINVSGFSTALSNVNNGTRSSDNNLPFSWSVWFKSRNSSNSQGEIAGYGQSQRNGIRIHNNVFRSNYTSDLAGTTTINQNVWYYGVVTYDGTTRKIYVNGSLDASDTPSSAAISNQSLTIGVYPNGSSSFNGELNELCYFDYALSESQITTLWGGGTSVSNPMALPNPPIAYYPLGTSAWNGNFLAENNAIGDYVFEIGNYPQLPIWLINAGTIADLNSNMAELSVSIWFKKTGGNRTSDYAILSKVGANNPTSFGLFWKRDQYATQGINTAFKINNGSVQAVGGQSNTGNEVSITIEDNKWYNLVGTYDGTTQSLYINGILHDYKSTSGNITGVSDNFILGAGIYDFYNWPGELSNCMIWTKGLSQSEVTTIYNYGSPIRTLASIPQNSNLKAWYKLDASEIYNSSSTEWSVDNNANTSTYDTSINLVRASSQKIDIANGSELDFTGDFTMSIWVNLTTSNNNMGIFNKTSQANSNGVTLWKRGGANFEFYVSEYSNYLTFASQGDNIWQQITITLNRTTGERIAYVNGEQAATLTHIKTFTFPNQGWDIGTFANNSLNYLDAKVSNFKLFNSVLSPTEVQTLYNNGTPLTDMSSFTSLQGWWKLNNLSSGLTDSSSNSNNATITNSATDYAGFVNALAGDSSGMSQTNLVQSDLQTVAPYSKYAMSFDGTDYIDCGHINLTSAFSLSFWTKYTTTSTVNIITQNNSSQATFGMYQLSDGKIRFWVTSSGSYNSSNEITADTVTNDGNWNNIVLINDGTNLKIYINGSLDNSSSNGVSSPYNGTANFWIGGSQAGGNKFNGSISNVSLWTYALTSSEIREIYNEGLPSNLHNFSGTAPVSWWQLGENSSYVSGWVFADEMPAGNNGTGYGLAETALTNGVGTTANGVSTGMSVGALVGNAPYSTANAVSSGMSVVSRVSGVSDATITTGGTGYSTGTNIATTGGSGTNCTINITTVSGGAITAITINSGGNDYLIGDVLTVSGGNGNATITVSGLNTP